MIKLSQIIIFIALLLLLAVMLVFPIKFGLIRAATVAVVGVLWIDCLFLCRRHRVLTAGCLLVALMSSAIIFWPGNIREPALRSEYVSALARYEGKHYLGGGENRIAVDCSGLLRSALMDANINYGIKHFRPALLREALLIWWYDSSSQAMRDGYRQRTFLLFKTPSLNKMDHALIRPGDMAVASNGQHVMAYLGNKVWIEADPASKRVIKVTVPAFGIGSFTTPVYLLRWRQLE